MISPANYIVPEKNNNELMTVVIILAVLLFLFIFVVNIARIKKFFFKIAKSKRGRLINYKVIKFYIKYRVFTWYVLIGCCTTIITVLIKNGLFYLFNNEHPYLSAEISWLFGALFAFFGNKYFVFKSKKQRGSVVFYEALTFFGSRLLSLIFDIFIIWIFHRLVGFDYTFISLISTIIQIAVNYFMVKYIVFNDKIRKILEPTMTKEDEKDYTFWNSEFIPTFSKDDEFIKYLENENK